MAVIEKDDQERQLPDEIITPETSASATTWRIVLKRFFRNKTAVIGLIILGIFLTIAIISFLDDYFQFFPYRPNEIFAGGANSFEGPSNAHPMGTDNVGRDILTRIIYGTRLSMTVGFIAVIFSLTVGTSMGLVAGYFGGKIDGAISMIIEILLSFPAILLALSILTMLGPGLNNAMLAVGIVYVPYYARIVRGQTLVERELVYVEAATVLGAGSSRVLIKHILPNILGTLVIYATLGIGTAILEVAALSFLGLGAIAPTAEWGAMIGDGRKYFASHPHLVFYPGIAIVLAVLSYNLVGDGLREALDPKLKR
jgi:ABC-type dipeptide/oligopeptide/nickel transport system permease subunit